MIHKTFLEEARDFERYEVEHTDLIFAGIAFKNLHPTFTYLPKKKFSQRFLDASWENIKVLREFLNNLTKERLKEVIMDSPKGIICSPYFHFTCAVALRVKRVILDSPKEHFIMELEDFHDLRDKYLSTTSHRRSFGHFVEAALRSAFPMCSEYPGFYYGSRYRTRDYECKKLRWYRPTATNKKGKEYSKPLLIEHNPGACTDCAHRVKCLAEVEDYRAI